MENKNKKPEELEKLEEFKSNSSKALKKLAQRKTEWLKDFKEVYIQNREDKKPKKQKGFHKIGKIDATATLIYAKTLNHKSRFAKPGECQYTMELEKQQKDKDEPIKHHNGLLSNKQSAQLLGVTPDNIQQHRRMGKIQSQKIGNRIYFKPEEIEKFRMQIAIDKL